MIRHYQELEDLRRGGIADAVLACAQRPDKGFAIVGLYIAYIVALPPALLHPRRTATSRRWCASPSVRERQKRRRGASRRSNIWIACASRRGRTGSTAGNYMWTPSAARQGRIVARRVEAGIHRVAVLRRVRPPRRGGRRCARCKHVFYCSVECQKAAWARPVAGHARTCAALGDLQKRAGAMTFGLDKMVARSATSGRRRRTCSGGTARLTQHRRWPGGLPCYEARAFRTRRGAGRTWSRRSMFWFYPCWWAVFLGGTPRGDRVFGGPLLACRISLAGL